MRKLLLILALLSLPCHAQMVKGEMQSDQVIPSRVFARVPLSAVDFDVPFDISFQDNKQVSMLIGGRFVAWKAGIYFFFAQVSFDTSCGGTVRSAYLLRNDNERQPFGAMMVLPPPCLDYAQFGLSGMTFLNAGETVTLAVWQDSGFPLRLIAKACSTPECSAITWVAVVKVL